MGKNAHMKNTDAIDADDTGYGLLIEMKNNFQS